MIAKNFFTYSIYGIWAAVVFGAYWLFHYEPTFILLALVLTGIAAGTFIVFKNRFKKGGSISLKLWYVIAVCALIVWVYIVVFGLIMSGNMSALGALYSLGYTTAYSLFLLGFFVFTTAFGIALYKIFLPKYSLPLIFKNGFGVIALIITATAMGWLNFFTPIAAVIVFISIVVFSYKELWDVCLLLVKKEIKFEYNTSTLAKLLESSLPVVGLLLLALFIMLGFRAMPLVADDLAVYYRVPLLFAEMGGIVPFYDGFTAAHYGAFSYVAALLHTVFPSYLLMVFSPYFFLLTIWAVYTAAFLYKDHRTGALAATIAAVTPWHIYFAFTSKVIMLFSFVSTLGVGALLLYAKKKQPIYLYIAALFFGAAVSIKLNGVFLALGFVGCLFVLLVRKNIQIKHFVFAGVMLLVSFLPQGITNTILYSDPLINTPGLHTSSDQLFEDDKTYLVDIVRRSTIRSERALEYLTIRQQNDIYSNPLSNTLWSLWNNTVHQRGYALLYIDIGFLSLVLLPLIFVFFYKNKNNTHSDLVIVTLFVVSGLVWLVFGKGSVWYGVAIWYVWWIIAARYLSGIKGKPLGFLYAGIMLQLFIVGVLALSSVQPANISWLTSRTSAQYIESSGLWYDTAEKVNELVDFTKGERVLFVPEQKAVYVEQNHKTVVADSLGHYWAQLLHEAGGDYARVSEELAEQRIRYIVHAKNSEGWLRSLIPQRDHDEYLLYTNLDTLHTYLASYTDQITCNDIACVYVVK
ncbi:MAG: ArnT family glycosyltransferase [Patescibacteria group bacterium]